MDKTIIVLCGIPCSGKSTWAKEFQKDKWINHKEHYQIISRDDLREQQFGKDYRPNSFAEKEISLLADLAMDHALLNDSIAGIILDNTHCKRAYLYDVIRKYGKKAAIGIMYFDISLSKAHIRNFIRKLKTGKWIPRDVIDTMYKNYTKIRKDEFTRYNIQSPGWFPCIWN